MEIQLVFSLSVCLFVCLCPINVKTAEPIKLKYVVESFMDDRNKKMTLPNFVILVIHQLNVKLKNTLRKMLNS